MLAKSAGQDLRTQELGFSWVGRRRVEVCYQEVSFVPFSFTVNSISFYSHYSLSLCINLKAKVLWRGVDRDLLSVGSFPTWQPWLELSQAKAKNQEIHPFLPHWWQEPKP